MKNGNISNVPAPSVVLDGHSIVEKKFFGFYRVTTYNNFILRISRKDYRIIVWFDKDLKKFSSISKGSLALDGIFYQEILRCSEGKLLRFLRRRETYLLTARDTILSTYALYAVDMRKEENSYQF